MRPLALAALGFILALAPAAAQTQNAPGDPRLLAVTASPIPLSLEDKDARSVGKLRWRGGVALKANDKRFGGWSGMLVAPDGRSLRAVSDEGSWLTAEIVLDARGDLQGLRNAVIGTLLGPDGAPMTAKADTDAESLAQLPNGDLLVGFERRHRVLRYPAGDERAGLGLAGRPQPFGAPADLTKAPPNDGLEAMTVLPDGRLFLVSENLRDGADAVVGWIGTVRGDDVAWEPFRYLTTGSYQPTDATPLPGGGVAMLERMFNPTDGVRVRIVRIPAADLRGGASIRPELLAQLQNPWAVDNLENIAATRGARGETLLWIASDDNFNALQQTLLMLFELPD